MNSVEFWEELIAQLRNTGKSIDDVVNHYLARGADPVVLQEARLAHEIKLGLVYQVDDPGTIFDKARVGSGWYTGPQPFDKFWPALKNQLSEKLSDDAIEKIDTSSTRIVGQLDPPGLDCATRGLVLGYVQSGKTTNFMSVIAKAADAGFRIFIILSGVTDSLRTQTQERVDEALSDLNPGSWWKLTTMDSDFKADHSLIAPMLQGDGRFIAVVKKNGPRLRRLKSWLRAVPGIDTLPIVVIDDEADQASIDVSDRKRARFVSRINGLIRQILSHKRSAYVAYTATPFANLLIDPNEKEDLYPRDFIVSLPLPDGYFGAEQIFGREEKFDLDEADADGVDVVRFISDDEATSARPPTGRNAVYSWKPALGAALRDAIEWYLLATAARFARNNGFLHSTMLVHTSMLGESHRRLSKVVQDYWAELGRGIKASDASVMSRLKALWNREMEKGLADTFGNKPVSFTELQVHLSRVIDSTEHIIDNYRSTQRLIYAKDAEKLVIVVGGNTLSRGLTLEGLISSYFVRSVSAYDTLLQMGRWFGYRPQYEDLVRLWITAELRNWFRDLSFVEAEIRQDIQRYALGDVKPIDVGVKIRTHPRMTITAAAKMRSAISASISYSCQRPQTIIFPTDDESFLDGNISAVRRLTKASLTNGARETGFASGLRGLENVAVEQVLEFIDEYQFHENIRELNGRLLRDYIESENSAGALVSWNVVFIEPTNDNLGTIELGLGTPVSLIRRSKLANIDQPFANVKAINSRIDRLADLPLGDEAHYKAAAKERLTDGAMLQIRDDRIGDKGLICVYPIDRKSDPKVVSEARTALDAAQDVIGISYFFPAAQSPTGLVDYKVANLPTPIVENEDDEMDEFNDVEEEDELASDSVGNV